MLAQNKLTYDEFVAYRKETEAWRAQVSAQLNGYEAQLNAIYAVLLSMGDKILDIENGIDENNAYQQMVLAMLQQYGYTQAEANALLREAINIAKQNGKTTADGMSYIIEQLKTIHNDLTTIIGQLDNAAKQREEEKNILKTIAITGQATKEQVEALNANIIETNNTIKEQGQKYLEQLQQLGTSVVDAIGELARINNCTRQDIIRGLAIIGVKIDNNTIAQYVTSGTLSAELQAALAKLDKLDADLNKLKEEFKNDAAMYAEKVIGLLEEINATLSAFVSEWAEVRDELMQKLNDLTAYARGIFMEEKYQSGMMNVIHRDFQDVKMQMKADHILLSKVYEKMQNDPSSLTKEDLEAIAEKLGANINASLEQLIALVKKEVEQGDTREQQLNSIEAKLNGLATLSQSLLNAIQNIDLSDLSALKSLGDKLDALLEAVNRIAGQIDKYADLVLKAHSNETAILKGIADDVSRLKNNSGELLLKADELIAQAKKANSELNTVNLNLTLLQNQVAQLEAKIQRPITVEELDSIMAKHDKENQEYYANLFKTVNLNPKDYTSALDYIADLIKLLVTGQGQTNQYLIELLEWAKQHPDRTDEIIQAIKDKEFNVVVTCECDCNNNQTIHEGIVTVVEAKENKDLSELDTTNRNMFMEYGAKAYNALMSFVNRA